MVEFWFIYLQLIIIIHIQLLYIFRDFSENNINWKILLVISLIWPITIFIIFVNYKKHNKNLRNNNH